MSCSGTRTCFWQNFHVHHLPWLKKSSGSLSLQISGYSSSNFHSSLLPCLLTTWVNSQGPTSPFPAILKICKESRGQGRAKARESSWPWHVTGFQMLLLSSQCPCASASLHVLCSFPAVETPHQGECSFLSLNLQRQKPALPSPQRPSESACCWVKRAHPTPHTLWGFLESLLIHSVVTGSRTPVLSRESGQPSNPWGFGDFGWSFPSLAVNLTLSSPQCSLSFSFLCLP